MYFKIFLILLVGLALKLYPYDDFSSLFSWSWGQIILFVIMTPIIFILLYMPHTDVSEKGKDLDEKDKSLDEVDNKES